MNNPIPIRLVAVILCISFLFPAFACADTLGPARSYDELLELAGSASDGDVLLISGELSAPGDVPLVTNVSLSIRSSQEGRASISSLCLLDADIGFADIDLVDTLRIEGTSNVHIQSGVSVRGANAQPGLVFSGNGSLLLDRGSDVTGGSENAGICIAHQGGDFYSDIAGTVHGGDGNVGGAGVEISPLTASGALMISGSISGGDGSSYGGNALNLYGLSGNAYVTVDGAISGGSGHVGGNGMQLVLATDNTVVGISGEIDGGQGEEFGGDALMLMSLNGSATVNLTGALKGGDATGENAHPGTSLLMVGDTTAAHARVNGCLLEDGKALLMPAQQAQIDVTPLPELTPSAADIGPLETPAPLEPAPGEPSDAPADERDPDAREDDAINPDGEDGGDTLGDDDAVDESSAADIHTPAGPAPEKDVDPTEEAAAPVQTDADSAQEE